MRHAIFVCIAVGVVAVGALLLYPPKEPREKEGMRITSSAFSSGGQIPTKYTADGENISPPLTIENIPDNTASLVIIMDDPDAPGSTFTHWLLWNIVPPLVGVPEVEPVTSINIPENIPPAEIVEVLDTARQGTNDFGEIGYGGPSPPPGSPHHYHFTAYALDTLLDLEPGATRDQLEAAMKGHVLDQAVLVGVYQR